MNSFRSFSFILGVIYLALFYYQNCFAKILDENGNVLQGVLEVFRQYKPLIEQHTEKIVQGKGLPKETIASILDTHTPVSNIALKDLNDIAQVVFLRPSNMERKDTKAYNEQFLPYTTQAVLDLFDVIGDLRPVYPKSNHYSYILLNGSTVANMRQRLKTLVDFVETKKIHIQPETQVIFLTGERDLFPEENEAQFTDPNPLKQDPSWQKPNVLPVTEDKAAEWIWNQSKLPDSLRKATITFVRAKKNPDGKRPTTFDTIQAWINGYKPKPGTCLSISSQPFVYYQEATIYGVFKKAGLLEQGFSVEGIGLGVENGSLDYFRENIAIVLDNFARTIYTEVQNAAIQG